ncbi:hypothetical protein N9V92_01160 [Luminiphilus sp.]|nr:hypothetical protein [Luminiphilus sp.]MDB2351777.1 hypothetical protein [Luminiphilus sp.]MDB2616702.1 hypothetical protein [Luminiphilus sp.]
MFKSATFKRNFAIVTALFAGLHFILEIFYTLRHGQTFLGLLPDLMADTLLLVGSYFLFKDPRLTGVICGAWGFTFCLHYRAWAWRAEGHSVGTLSEGEQAVMVLLAVTMVSSFLCFFITLVMNGPGKQSVSAP